MSDQPPRPPGPTVGRPDAEWAFGDGGFAKIYGDRLSRSSLLDTSVSSRWTFLFMLSQADAHGRFRCATIGALARAAAITVPQARLAIKELSSPDPHSTTKTEEGRRILPIPGGWQIVNYSRYRDFRTEQQAQALARKRRQRERQANQEAARNTGQRDMSRDVTAGHVQTSEGRSSSSATGGRRGDAPSSWSREACDDWMSRFEGATAPGGQIGKALKALVTAHGWPAVRAAWKRYLGESEARYASPARFAATWSDWRPAPETGAPASPEEPTSPQFFGGRE